MRKVSSIILILCVVSLCIMPCKVEAFTHSVKFEELYGHRSPDGTISFYVSDAKRSWIGDDDWYFSLHKVFTNEGQQFYYLYTDVSDGNIKKNPVTDVLIFINDKPISLKPMQEFDVTNNGEKYSGWYLVPPEIGPTLEKTQTLHLEFRSNGKSLKNIKKNAEAFKKLADVNKDQYIRDGKIMRSPQDTVEQVMNPQIFIANTKPEDIQAAIIYNVTYTKEKNKDEFLYYKGYRVLRTVKDTNLICLEGFEDIHDQNSFIVISCIPYSNGVWVNMGLTRKWNMSGAIRYLEYEDSYSGGLIDMRSYWRSKGEDWGYLLLKIANDFNGLYSSGLTWDQQKDKQSGAFVITQVDYTKHPELSGIKSGDLITSINGTPTISMRSIDLSYKLNTNDKPIVIGVKTSDGNINITVTPTFMPSNNARIDYIKAISKIPKKFIDFDDEILRFSRAVFYPIEK